MKRKTLTMILCLLTVLSVVGVGFASWVISADGHAETSGNIQVDTVTDKRLVVTATATNPNIVLAGKAKDDATAPKWLNYTGDKTANLVVEYDCTIKYASSTIKFASPQDVKQPTAVFTEPDNDNYEAAKTAKCFSYVGCVVSNVTMKDEDTLKFTVTITYEWGDAFDGQNPFNYYNAVDKASNTCTATENPGSHATWGDHASHYLGLLDAIDASGLVTEYNLTIDVKHKDSN